MFGPPGVKSTPSHIRKSGTDVGFRLRASSALLIGALSLLASWWFLTGTALARSYPPALGCAVAGSASADGRVLEVRGMGFRAGARVQVRVAGRRAGSAVADPAGSFEAAWLVPSLTSGARVAAADGSCAVTSSLSVQDQQYRQGDTPPPPPLRSDPVVAVIPLIPLTGLPSQLILGLAGALLLAGAALTGLTGRWGHRGERRPATASSVSSTLPLVPGDAWRKRRR
ncbi:MAG: hypothetical protein ABI047_07275 [Jatrophihabitantaceae bacterium]